MNEWEQIAWFKSQVADDPRVLLGIGDDTALVRLHRDVLITVDMLVEDVHFELDKCTPFQVGQKAMNVNLSDIAAMAGTPTVAVVAVALPKNRPGDLAAEVFRGLHRAASQFGVTIVGGDTNRSPRHLCVSVTLLGEPAAKGPLTRSGAQPGDFLFATGELGYSLDGKHLDFVPRVRESLALHEAFQLTSMMDISDGLGSDLFHLTDQSNCGALLDAKSMPIRLPASAFAPDDRSPLDHALNDGEDFELLFTAPPEEGVRLLREQPLQKFGVRLSQIGVMTTDRQVQIILDGDTRPLQRGGFQHQW